MRVGKSSDCHCRFIFRYCKRHEESFMYSFLCFAVVSCCTVFPESEWNLKSIDAPDDAFGDVRYEIESAPEKYQELIGAFLFRSTVDSAKGGGTSDTFARTHEEDVIRCLEDDGFDILVDSEGQPYPVLLFSDTA